MTGRSSALRSETGSEPSNSSAVLPGRPLNDSWITTSNLGRIEAVGSFRRVREILSSRGGFSRATVEEPVEEVLGHDQDQREDDAQLKHFPIFEPVEQVPNAKRAWIDLGSPLPRERDHVFRYFLDGSLRTYRWGEKVEGGTSFPVIVTELGCAVVKRSHAGIVKTHTFKRRLCLLLPPAPPVSSDTASELAALAAGGHHNSRISLEVVHLLRERHQGDLRSALLGKARSVMHELEVQVASNLRRESDDWLVIDGAIRKGIFVDLPRTIGVAKSFSRSPLFVFPPAHRPVDVVSMLRGMPESSRTPVFLPRQKSQTTDAREGQRVASWYVRIRRPQTRGFPLEGIVKIDYVVEGEWKSDRDLPIVERLSRALVAERSVSSYPTPRWATHLYPVYCAENYLKASLLNPIVMRGIMEA